MLAVQVGITGQTEQVKLIHKGENMKIIITQITDITPMLTRQYKYNLVTDEDAVLLSDQSLESKPSEAQATLRNKLDAFRKEYEIDDIEIGMEIV